MSPPKSYLEKAGMTRGSLYVLGMILSGGGFIEKNHFDSTSAMQAQLIEQTTAIALIQQEQGQQEKKLDELSREIRQLTRAFDTSVKELAAN